MNMYSKLHLPIKVKEKNLVLFRCQLGIVSFQQISPFILQNEHNKSTKLPCQWNYFLMQRITNLLYLKIPWCANWPPEIFSLHLSPFSNSVFWYAFDQWLHFFRGPAVVVFSVCAYPTHTCWTPLFFKEGWVLSNSQKQSWNFALL
jgi:hypothetical protein